MTDRHDAAAVIKVEDRWRSGETRTWFVGPFMPHLGSAVDAACADLAASAEQRSDLIASRTTEVHLTFLAPGESDLDGLR